MVSRFGRPSVAPKELNWAFDPPTGARITDFFLSKVQSGNESLGNVALEKEERDILTPTSPHASQRISKGTTHSPLRASRVGLTVLKTLRDPPSSSSAPGLSVYKRPSQLRFVSSFLSVAILDGRTALTRIAGY
jgi:hypothetical protein